MTQNTQMIEKYIQVEGLTIRYMDGGEGRPIVLIHALGVQNSADQWARDFPELLKIGRVIAWDTPGWGKSDFSLDGEYSFPFWLHYLRGFCDALGLDQFDIMGQSLGAWIAALFAHQNPNRIRRAVLLAMAGLNPQAPLTSDRFRLPTMEGLRSQYPTEESAQIAYDSAHRPGREHVFKVILDYINDPDVRGPEWGLATRLPDMSMPILFGNGDLNKAIPAEYTLQAFKLTPKGRVIVLPSAGAPGGYNTPELVRAGIEFLTAETIEPAH